MKAIWLCNILLPEVAKALGAEQPVVGGWISGQISALRACSPDLQLIVVCPHHKTLSGSIDGLTYYTFVTKDKTKYSVPLKSHFETILRETEPDVIHLWGCEYPHAWSMTQAAIACGLGKRTLLHVQGLLHVYEKHYYGTMDFATRYRMSLRDIAKCETVAIARRNAKKRGEFEKKVIRNIAAIAGRTQWDHACTARIQPDAIYYHCRETLRDAFYQGEWSVELCQRHTIFFSQPDRFVKAFYQLLRVFPTICARYPDARIITTGNLMPRTFGDRLRQSGYLMSLRRMIVKNKLEQRIECRGSMDESQIRQAFLQAHVFVSCSSIENSPNSLGEAMLLGVPCIASDVGGVAELMIHQEEGFVYPFDEEYMLAWYIGRLFNDDTLSRTFSKAASAHAREQYDRTKSAQELMAIYRDLCPQQKESRA